MSKSTAGVPFVEEDCTITHEGRTFTAGGAWLADCPDGYRRGVVYANPGAGIVTDWHGNVIARASYGKPYQGPFCTMQSVSFVVDGILYAGRWCPDWASAVNVRSTRKVQS